MEWSTKLRIILAVKQMNHSELAGALGVSQTTVSRYASGDQEPTIGVAIRIANTLGVTLDELFMPTVDLPARCMTPPVKPDQSKPEIDIEL